VLAIGVDGGFNVDDDGDYDVVKDNFLRVYPSGVDVQLPNDDLPTAVTSCVDAILAHAGFHEQEEVAAWQETRVTSRYAATLAQEPSEGRKIPPDSKSWRCAETGVTENLWLNLSDGHIGSGRKNWDGSGGNGSALRHYDACKAAGKEYPLAVKLGTITPAGADVYSYAADEDDMVTDPRLAEHLAHWGIDVMRMEKTEKSMAELQIDLNKGFEFDKITEAGAELERVSGASRVGLKNTGNTCYVNSVLQVLKEVPNIDARYRGNADVLFETAPADPTNDFPTQFAKLFAALNTDRYARDLENEDENLEIPEIAPRMFKQLVGKNHAEFSTGRQQDAVEYFQHLLEVMTRAEQNDVCKNDRLGTKAREREREEFVSSAKQFEFDVEEKVTCAVSGAVRYVRRRENVLPLEVPVDAATNAREIEAERERKRQRTARANEGATSSNEDEKNDAATDGVRPVVPFDACLAQFAADETVEDWFSTATGAKGAATRRSRFATFPEVLPVQVRRYYVASDWTPKKLDALVPMPETIDLGALRGVGLQPGETELPETADTTAAAVPENPPRLPPPPRRSSRTRRSSRSSFPWGSARTARGEPRGPRATPAPSLRWSGSLRTWRTLTSTTRTSPRGARRVNPRFPVRTPPRARRRSRCSARWASPTRTPPSRFGAPTATSSARRIGSSRAPTTSTRRSRRRRRSWRAARPARRLRGGARPATRPRRASTVPRRTSCSASCRTWAATPAAGTTSRTSRLTARGTSSTIARLRSVRSRRSSSGTSTSTGASRETSERIASPSPSGCDEKSVFTKRLIFRVFSDSAHRSPLRLHSTKRARPSRPSQFTSTIGYSFTQVPRAYRIPQVLKLWRDPATFTCGPSPPASYFRTPLMAKNGIGIPLRVPRATAYRHLGRLGLRG
jgi:uncharacterized UBP type Zn finger protein